MADASRTGWSDLPLEAVAAAAPDIIVTGFMNGGTEGVKRVERQPPSRHAPCAGAAPGDFRSIPAPSPVSSWLAADEAVRLNAFARQEAQPMSVT